MFLWPSFGSRCTSFPIFPSHGGHCTKSKTNFPLRSDKRMKNRQVLTRSRQSNHHIEAEAKENSVDLDNGVREQKPCFILLLFKCSSGESKELKADFYAATCSPMKFKISSETPFRSHKQTDLEIALCCNAISAFTQTYMIALENNHTVVQLYVTWKCRMFQS